MGGPFISIVTPVFNEAENLEEFLSRLRRCMDGAALRWEWLAVDDGSTDGSREDLAELAAVETRLRVLLQDRNRGSHAAIFRGLREAQGDFAVVLTADLQDPPEIIPKLVDESRTGAAIVWAARTRPAGATMLDRFFSAAYHRAIRIWTALPAPPFGADCFLASRAVLDQMKDWPDFGPNLALRVLSLPVRQRRMAHDRQPRKRGHSGWSFTKKLKLAITSLAAFTDAGSWWLWARIFTWHVGQAIAAPGASGALKRLVRRWFDEHPVIGDHLDVGCGSHSRLSNAGLQPTGVDADASRMALFHSNGGDGLVASSTGLPFPPETFVAAWSFGLLHHLSDEDAEKTLFEMQRVTAPAGRQVVFDSVTPRSKWTRPLAALVRALDAGPHVRTEGQLRALLARHGTWDCRRITYAWNGLEGLFCTRHKSADPAC